MTNETTYYKYTYFIFLGNPKKFKTKDDILAAANGCDWMIKRIRQHYAVTTNKATAKKYQVIQVL